MSRHEQDEAEALEPSTRPRVVDEAYEVMASWSQTLMMSALGATVLWFMVSTVTLITLPMWGLPIVYVVLGLLYLLPPSREPRLALDVLRKWDDLRVDRALGSAGIYDDPRLEVAEAMADRVLRHPSVEEGARERARMLVRRLKLVLSDLRRVEWLVQTGSSSLSPSGRSISDLQDTLDVRVAGILGQLTEIHRTVVMRDADALGRALASVDDLLRELEAEREVDRLLSEAEGRG